MSYEEKYNEILEWARKNKARLNGVPIEEVLPELTESEDEDERTRKALIETVKCIYAGDTMFLSEQQRDRYLAYLEKQAEEKFDLIDRNFRRGREVGYREGVADTIAKQKEQKPAESISQLTVQGKGVYKICPRCKERMIRDDSKVYTSMPPQYRYECPKCGESECDTVMYDNPEMEEQKPAEYGVDVIKTSALLAADRLASAEMTGRLKERSEILDNPTKYGLQKPAEWSEEDKRAIDRACVALRAYANGDLPEFLPSELIGYADRLQSLRPSWKPSEVCYGPTGDPDPAGVWKPSEEQMKALKDAVKLFKETHFEKFHYKIESLYEQLKKLM